MSVTLNYMIRLSGVLSLYNVHRPYTELVTLKQWLPSWKLADQTMASYN